jgi:hypothetical protein
MYLAECSRVATTSPMVRVGEDVESLAEWTCLRRNHAGQIVIPHELLVRYESAERSK